MAKEIACLIKLQIESGKANPAPPVGTALGPRGVNIMNFCREFNDRTSSTLGVIIPVVITVYKDKSFDFVLKKPPVSGMIKRAIGIEFGSKEPGRSIVATIKMSQVIAIAKEKIVDMTAASVESAVKEIVGSAYSMGVEVVND